MSNLSHQAAAAVQAADQPVCCAVLTISDTRTAETDRGGPLIRTMLTEAGHKVLEHSIVRDDLPAIAEQLDRWLTRDDLHAILTTGGTGIAPRDTTIEVVRSRLTRELEGFGELFRMLSWEQVRASAMLSRAVAGLVVRPSGEGGDTFVFSMPGSTNAIETAMKNLIVPELAHLVWERSR